jgi:hypothetical protein
MRRWRHTWSVRLVRALMTSFCSRWCNRAPIALSPLKRLAQPRLGDLGDGLDRSGDDSQRVWGLVMGHVLSESRGFPWSRAVKGKERSRGFPWSRAWVASVQVTCHVLTVTC